MVKKSSGASLQTILKKINNLEKSQQMILKNQEAILEHEKIIRKEEGEIEDLEKKELAEEERIEQGENKELEELKKIEDLENNIKKNINTSPLRRITYRDITKGMIGAFIGIVGHFSFTKGIELGQNFSYTRSSLLLFASFLIIICFIYFTGFRKITDGKANTLLPWRAIVIYVSAITTIFIVLLLYGKIDLQTPFHLIYNAVATISILAVLGAGAADLIGKNEE